LRAIVGSVVSLYLAGRRKEERLEKIKKRYELSPKKKLEA
jgi:hypothetical protein